MNSFRYVLANSIPEAVSLVKNGPGEYMAGGTDILMDIKARNRQPNVLVDIKGIEGLSGINADENQIHIGALTAVRELETSKIIIEKVPVLALAASKLGSVQIRNRATVGGNLCNAAPSAELAPTLLCLNAKVEIFGAGGSKEVPLDQFFVGPRQTVLKDGEIMTGISFPFPEPRLNGVYYKLSARKAMDIAFVGIAVFLQVSEEKILDARIGLGAVAPVPMRARAAEELLRDGEPTQERVKAAAEAAADACRPISDIRANAEYRREMVRNLVERGIWETYRA